MKQQASLLLNRLCNFTLAKTSCSGYIVVTIYVVNVAQLVAALGCGPGGRGFESHHSPHPLKRSFRRLPETPFFYCNSLEILFFPLSILDETNTLFIPETIPASMSFQFSKKSD